MAIELNHTLVHARDPQASAAFLAEILGRGAPVRFGPFYGVELDNRVTLDFIQAGDGELTIEHYAFLVSEDEFDTRGLITDLVAIMGSIATVLIVSLR